MRRRIFRYMSTLALASILLSSTLVLVVLYPLFNSQMQKEIESKAAYITAGLNQADDRKAFFSVAGIQNDTTRITLVDKDGTVRFDNMAQSENMDNHLSRPEISEAFINGTAQSVRLSSTLGSQTFYYAVLLDDGTVVRLANTTGSVFSAFIGILPLMLLIAAAVFALAIPLAKKMTNRIITPINTLSLENPSANSVYDELSPLLSRIKKQHRQITQQMDELRARQEDFATITSHMSEGLIVLEAKANILTVNKSAIHLLGAEKASYVGKNILTLSRNLTLHRAAETALSGSHCDAELAINNRICQLFASPVYDHKAVKGAILLVLDVSEWHKAEKIRREFSANVSHELKTPLTSISGYAELLKNGMVKAEDIFAFADRIYLEGRRLIALVEDIIMISELDEKKVQLPVEKVNLLELAKRIAVRLLPQTQDKCIKITVSGDSVEILAIKQLMDELIYNLCENAVKYNKLNGQVEVHVFLQNENAVLTVSDSGIGISKQHQERVFERFYRVDKSHSKLTGGTGLGLSIVKHIAEYHNAEIKLESEENVGTIFTVIFPHIDLTSL